MKLLVFCKPIPDLKNLSVSQSQGRVFERGKRLFNPFDEVALEAALKLKGPGDEITALTLGREEEMDLPRKALAMGADRAYLVVDSAASEFDAWQRSNVLAGVAQLLGFDLLFFGARSPDGGLGQTGLRVAVTLGLPYLLHVSFETEGETSGWSAKSSGRLCVGSDFKPPLVAVIDAQAYHPRTPSAPSIMKAFKRDIPKLPVSSLQLSEEALKPKLHVRASYLA